MSVGGLIRLPQTPHYLYCNNSLIHVYVRISYNFQYDFVYEVKTEEKDIGTPIV